MAAVHSGYRWTPLGYFQLSVTNAAQSLAVMGAAIPADAVMALIGAETAAVRWRDDGQPPTATVGMPLSALQEFQYTVTDFSQIQFITQTVNATLNVSFYK